MPRILWNAFISPYHEPDEDEFCWRVVSLSLNPQVGGSPLVDSSRLSYSIYWQLPRKCPTIHAAVTRTQPLRNVNTLSLSLTKRKTKPNAGTEHEFE
jgi:hypothetical protein